MISRDSKILLNHIICAGLQVNRRLKSMQIGFCGTILQTISET